MCFFICLPYTNNQCDKAAIGESLTTLVPNDKDRDQESLGPGFACLFLKFSTINKQPV